MTQATTRGDFKEDRDYDSYVSTPQPATAVVRLRGLQPLPQGVAQALLSDERFRSQSQELLVRVLEAYTGALLAQDQIELARAQKRSYREQFQLNQRQFERGNGTHTDTLETQAASNPAQAQEIEARDSQDAALRELERLVGAPLEIADLAPLGERFQVRPLSPASYTAWRDLALAENPELASLPRGGRPATRSSRTAPTSCRAWACTPAPASPSPVRRTPTTSATKPTASASS